MSSHIEREIKLHYTSHDNARLAVEQLEGTLLRDRRLQDDYLLDLPGGNLKHRGCTLRVRIEKHNTIDNSSSDNASLTFKAVSYTHLTLPPTPYV